MGSSNNITIYSLSLFLLTSPSSFISNLLPHDALAIHSFLMSHRHLSPFHIDISFECTYHDTSFKLDQCTKTLYMHYRHLRTQCVASLSILCGALGCSGYRLSDSSRSFQATKQCDEMLRLYSANHQLLWPTLMSFCIRYFYLPLFNKVTAGTHVQFTACCMLSCRGRSCQLQSHLISTNTFES